MDKLLSLSRLIVFSNCKPEEERSVTGREAPVRNQVLFLFDRTDFWQIYGHLSSPDYREPKQSRLQLQKGAGQTRRSSACVAAVSINNSTRAALRDGAAKGLCPTSRAKLGSDGSLE